MLGSFNKTFKRGPVIPVLYVKERRKRKRERKGKKKEGSETGSGRKNVPGSHSKYMEEQGFGSYSRTMLHDFEPNTSWDLRLAFSSADPGI